MTILDWGLASKFHLRLTCPRRLFKSQGRTLNRFEPPPFGGCKAVLAALLLGFARATWMRWLRELRVPLALAR